MFDNGIACSTRSISGVGYCGHPVGYGIVGDLGGTTVAVHIRYFLSTPTLGRV